MTEIETFRQQLDDTERLAKEATPGPWIVDDPNEGGDHLPFWMVINDAFLNPPADDEDSPWLAVELHTGVESDARHIARHDPAWALRWVAAAREILAELERELSDDPSNEMAKWMLSQLMSVYPEEGS